MNANFWIRELSLSPHPEGGYYCSTYKSEQKCYNEKQSASLIYFLLKESDFSAFHRLKSDEVWLYHKGCTVHIYMLINGKMTLKKLGTNPHKNEELQVFVPANTWFAADCEDKDSYSLMSCLVTPNFEWSEFELGSKAYLSKNYPTEVEWFEKLCIR